MPKVKKGSEASTDAIPKIFVLGEQGQGKTALLSRLTRNEFRPNEPTERVKTDPLRVVDGRQAAFFEYGTDFLSRPDTQSPGTAICGIVVSDGLQPDFGERCNRWIAVLDCLGLGADRPRALVLTRIDTGAIDPRIEELGLSSGFSRVFRTSAKTNQGINQLSSYLINDIRWPEVADEAHTPIEQKVIFAVRTLTDKLCRLVAKDPKALEHIEWRQLEQVVANSLESYGFEVELTPASKDGGKDIVLTTFERGKREIYYIEIKHWREGGRPGMSHVSNFVQVNIRDQTRGGLFLSSSGFRSGVHSRLAEIHRQNIHLGNSEKIVALCQHFVRTQDHCWVPQSPLAKVLQEDTLAQ